MLHEPHNGKSNADDSSKNIGSTIAKIGETLACLEPGELASLRRMSLDGEDSGAPYFWRLASRHHFGGPERTAVWARIVQIMAILTAKGSPDDKGSPHTPRTKASGYRGLGHALCDGGDPSWGQGETDPRPMLSELRFARLLAARGPMRTDLMERAARALAARKPDDAGVDCADLARLLLFDGNPEPARKLARDYYDRLDRATSRGDADDSDDEASGDAR